MSTEAQILFDRGQLRPVIMVFSIEDLYILLLYGIYLIEPMYELTVH